jgi:glycogen synthase
VVARDVRQAGLEVAQDRHALPVAVAVDLGPLVLQVVTQVEDQRGVHLLVHAADEALEQRPRVGGQLAQLAAVEGFRPEV